MSDLNLDWLISVDDHVLEPGQLWLDRLPAKYHDVAPRLVEQDGGEYWMYEDRRTPTTGLSVTAGVAKESWSMQGVRYSEMRWSS